MEAITERISGASTTFSFRLTLSKVTMEVMTA